LYGSLMANTPNSPTNMESTLEELFA
jgi:hypothetical protein